MAWLIKGGRRCWRSHSQYNPPTTACGATSVFETPSVLRESLPSYSAKPGAFYAPRALRWTTPPRGRTDPFQGPKIKPMFHRCSMLFQDDFGVENGSQNRANIDQNQAWARSKTLLEPGRLGMGFAGAFGSLLGLPGTPKIVLPLQCGHNFCLNRRPRRGVKIDPILVQNRCQKPPWSCPGGV